MNWFGRKAAAAASRPALSRAWMSALASSLGEWPQSYDGQLRAALLANPVAQRAVRLVSEAVGSAALSASADGPAQGERALALVTARVAGEGLLEGLAAHVLLHGNGYVQIAEGAMGEPARLFALRPERVTVEPDGNGWPVAYAYRVGERVTRYAGEDASGRTQLVHIRALNPMDDHYGLGCLSAAAGAVAIHNGGDAVEQGAARQCGAAVGGAGL